MDFDNIIETRSVEDGRHSLMLEVAMDEYKKDYDDYNADHAFNILERHLEHTGDDGKPSNIEIDYDEENNLVKIFAQLDYLGNDHTDYRFK